MGSPWTRGKRSLKERGEAETETEQEKREGKKERWAGGSGVGGYHCGCCCHEIYDYFVHRHTRHDTHSIECVFLYSIKCKCLRCDVDTRV